MTKIEELENAKRYQETQNAAGQAAYQPPTKEDEKLLAVAKELAQMFQEQINHLSRRIYEVERGVAKFHRAFETMFKEEMDKRMNGKQGILDECTASAEGMSSRIERSIQKMAAGQLGGRGLL